MDANMMNDIKYWLEMYVNTFGESCWFLVMGLTDKQKVERIKKAIADGEPILPDKGVLY